MTLAQVQRLFVSLCTFFVVVCVAVSCDVVQQAQRAIPPTDSLQNGDIAFRKGSSAANIFLSAADPEARYTHVGIITIIDGTAMVIHSVPDEAEPGDIDRVKIEPLADFFWGLKALAGAIYRPTTLSPQQKETATTEAYRWYEKRAPFDASYTLGDTSRIYCTELLMLAFQKCGYDITSGSSTDLDAGLFVGKYIFPSDIASNEDLELIYSF